MSSIQMLPSQSSPFRLSACLAVLFSAFTSVALAQTPVAIPSASTLLAGGANSSGSGISGKTLPTSGSPCFVGSVNTATDTYGDGCPGVYAGFSSDDFRGGVAADGEGNIFVIENTAQLIRKIDAKSGIITALNSGGTGTCTGALDGYGDGCPVVNFKLNGARGGYTDPYGNLILGGYSAQMVNILCNAVSPLCPNTANHKQVGYMYRIAGCTNSASAGGTASVGATPGTAGDGLVASPFGNLSGDVADWGAGISGYPSAQTNPTTCGNTNGGVDQPRGAIADKYGNVYIADTANIRYRVVVGPPTFTLPNGTVLTNPLPAILQLDTNYTSVTAAQMYGHIYPIFGAFTSGTNGGFTIPTAKGTACVGTYASGGTTLDTVGDGCPFYESTGGTSTSSTLGVGVDSEGNPVFLDQNNKAVRVLYIAGPRMKAAIQAANNNASLTVTPGYLYPIVGLPGTASAGLAYAPALGTTLQPNSNGSRMAVDPAGNLYFGDYGKNSVYMFDLSTGYARNVLVTGTVCSTTAPNHDSLGDGCSEPIFAGTAPTASNFAFGSGASAAAISITFDPHGNLILGDITNEVIRKINATDLVPVQVGTTLTQTLNIHNPAGTTGMTASLATASPDIALSAPTCNTANLDTTMDCTVTATFTPLTPGKRTGVMKVATTGTASSANFVLSGTATGSALTTDLPTPIVAPLGTVTAAVGLAVDGAGNIALTDSGNFVGIAQGSTTSTTLSAGTAPASVTQIAIDNAKNIYAVNSSATITELAYGASGYTATTLPYLLPAATYASTPATLTATAQINGIAVDNLGNVFFSDQTNRALFEIPAGNGFETLNQVVPIMTGFTTVGDVAVDGQGNVFVADTGAGKVYRILNGTSLFPTPTVSAATAVASSVVPTHIAADVAGNLYVDDATAQTVTEVPVSGAKSTVFTTANTPTGVAVDSNGSVYETEATQTAVNKINRSAATYTLPSPNSTLAVTFSNTGNLAATGYAQTDPAEFPYTTGTTNGCGTIPSTSNGLAVGASCTTTAKFTPGNNGALVTSAATLLAASSTTGSLTLSGQEPQGTTYTTTTGVTGPSAASYAATGTEITFTATESSTNNNSQNGESLTIAVTNAVATVQTTTCVLASGSCTIALSGLSAGAYTITATYSTDGTYLGSSGSTTFNITQVTPVLAWTPSATTQPYSAPLGNGVLDATATYNSATVPGIFVYTASGVEVHAATYLATGNYALGVTFYPTDATDFASNTASVPSYNVTQATTSAPIGGTQIVVAQDGSTNYSTVQAAVNALGVTGGSVYIKPGTYIGDVTVVQPNVALRGLGGDPTKVVLTHAGGAFGGSGVYAYAGEFNSSQNNGYQLPAGSSLSNGGTGDQGSATLVVARGTNTAFSSTVTTPNNFYAEYLTLQNTYDTDNSTTTTTYLPSANSGTCTANEGPAQTYQYLYNNQILCASQALAIWLQADTAVMNNVYTTSQQDTIYAAAISAGNSPSRQYWFRGKVSGDVDYIFGDAAAVFDHTSIFSTWHGFAPNGTITVEAQNKSTQNGSSSDYLSGYIMNSNVFTSQSTGMTSLYFGRPYGTYSTWVMLNSQIDQLNTGGSGYTTGLGPSLVSATYGEYNDTAYTDPAGGSADPNGVIYNCVTVVAGYNGTPPCGGNTGQNVLPVSARESASTDPGYTPFNGSSSNNVVLSQPQAQPFYPLAFLGKTITPGTYNSVATWNPLTAIATNANAFVPASSPSSITYHQPLVLMMRPQTPGLGAVTNGVYTVPTGTWTLYDNGAQLASGTLDASGEKAYDTLGSLSIGSHSFTWTYSGDSNFAGSSTGTAYAVTVVGVATTTTLSETANPIAYGQPASVTAAVSTASGTPTGNVTLTIDGGSTVTQALSSGATTFTVSGLAAGSHSFTASYGGDTTYATSTTTSSLGLTVTPLPLVVTGSCTNRAFYTANSCSASVTGTYGYSDTAATVFATGPAGTTTALKDSPAGSYPTSASYTLTTAGSTNYSVSTQTGTTFTISGSNSAAQKIVFAALPPLPAGTYQLTARSTSGLPVTYSVTGTGASISGNTLVLSGATGQTITVTANTVADPNNDYAAATAISRSFTAQ